MNTIILTGSILALIIAIVFVYFFIQQVYEDAHKYDILYTKETKKETLNTLTEAEQGEFLMCMAMNKLKEYKRANFNVYFKIKSGTTEVDSILVHKSGIYIFESKCYAGKVIGNWDDEYWTQKINFKKPRKFYNPILQNSGHVQAVKNYMKKRGYPECPIYSIIAFSDHTKVKQQRKDNVYVCKYADIKQIIKNITNKTEEKEFLTKEQIDRYHWAFDTLANPSEDTKKRHIEFVSVINEKARLL